MVRLRLASTKLVILMPWSPPVAMLRGDPRKVSVSKASGSAWRTAKFCATGNSVGQRRTTADRGQALPRRSGAPGRHRPGGRGANHYHEVGGSRCLRSRRPENATEDNVTTTVTSCSVTSIANDRTPVAVHAFLVALGFRGSEALLLERLLGGAG